MEATLYAPVKRFLEGFGYDVKGEICGCDLVGLRGHLEGHGDPIIVVCELKLRFSLELILQAVDRSACCDEVWIAARISGRAKGRESDARFRALCRKLGFGMLGVTDAGSVELLVAADSAAPRRNPRRRSRLVAEHRRRRGDPAIGGSSRTPIMTAYRQQALAIARVMEAAATPLRPRDLRPDCPQAATILARNVYGWFERAARGHYALTPLGHDALLRWPCPDDASVVPP